MTSDEFENSEVSLVAVFTLVLWLACVAVGLTGLLSPPANDPVPLTQPAAPSPQILEVSVMDAPPQEVSPSPISFTPRAPDIPPRPVMPPNNPAIAFAVPTILSTPMSASPNPLAVQRLTLGVGPAIQPRPEYPREAQLARQQGTVEVIFTVGQGGGVTEAHISAASWPLLNSAALRAIRQSWHFPPGPVRTYEVAIQFELTQP